VEKIKSFFVLFLIVFQVASFDKCLAADLSESEIEAAITQTLKQRHPSDTPEWWKGLGPKAPAVIRRMYEQSRKTYHKVRLIQALGWFHDPENKDFIKEQVTNSDLAVVRNYGLRTLAIGFEDQEIEFLSKYLRHANLETRYFAADAIKRIADSTGSEDAKAILEHFSETESSKWIVEKLEGKKPKVQFSKKLVPTEVEVARKELVLPHSFKGKWVAFAPELKKDRSQAVFLELSQPIGKMVVLSPLIRPLVLDLDNITIDEAGIIKGEVKGSKSKFTAQMIGEGEKKTSKIQMQFDEYKSTVLVNSFSQEEGNQR